MEVAAASQDFKTPTLDSSLHCWIQAFAVQCRDALAELDLLTPWAASPREFSKELAFLDEIPTLGRAGCLGSPVQVHLDTGAGCGVGRHAQRRPPTGQIQTDTPERTRPKTCDVLAQMKYGFLYDDKRHLLAIGYNVDELRRDQSFYDLLASEGAAHNLRGYRSSGSCRRKAGSPWGRLLSSVGGTPILLSWSGSMFEYLMPNLVMPTYEHTLLDQTIKAAVARQIEYGRKIGVPWGISECGYNAIDAHRNYQYHAFGAPGLGLKRGLASDMVIAPYATAFGAPGEPEGGLQKPGTPGGRRA